MQKLKQLIPAKKPYSTPELTVHGDVDAITKMLGDGDYTDATFPMLTRREDITFSP